MSGARPGAAGTALLCTMFAVTACGTLSGGAPGPTNRWLETRPEDVILITSFRQQGAAASDRSTVFAASPFGVARYDQRFQRWLAPLTAEDGFPAGEVPVALAVDEFGNDLWLAMRGGAVYTVPLGISGRWRWVGTVPGGTIRAMTAADGTAYVSTSAGWYMAAGAGGALVPVAPGRLPGDVSRKAVPLLDRLDDGAFAASASAATTDRWLRRWPVSAAAESHLPGRYWLATWGGGLFQYDDRTLNARQMPFGLSSVGAGALAFDGDYLWIIGDGTGSRGGVTRARSDLQDWYWYDGRYENAPSSAGRAVVPTPGRIWFATRDGLYALERESDRWRRFGAFDGIQSADVRALVWTGGRLWVGTDRGLAVGGGEGFQPLGLGGIAVAGLAAADGRVYAATAAGLRVFDAASAQPVALPRGASLDTLGVVTRLERRIDGVAAGATGVHVVVEDRVLTLDADAGWRESPLPIPGAIGRVLGLTAGGGTVWVAGTGGAAMLDPIGGSWLTLVTGREIPEGPVYQVMPATEGVWFATRAGALWMPRR